MFCAYGKSVLRALARAQRVLQYLKEKNPPKGPRNPNLSEEPKPLSQHEMYGFRFFTGRQ
jgi:hypothetical protein